jgi:hypothetical protein
MKIHTIKNRWFLPVLSCAALAMTSHSQGAVIVYFEQVDGNVVATWTGSFDAGNWVTEDNDGVQSGAAGDSLIGIAGAFELYGAPDGFGAASVDGFGGTVDAFTGSVGFSSYFFAIGGTADGLAPLLSVYNFDDLIVTQTFRDDTLESIGADSFDNTLAWTSSAGGEILYTTGAVPEPSSTALVGLGALALAVRRRR